MVGIANRGRPKSVLIHVRLDSAGRFLWIHIDEPDPDSAVAIHGPDALYLGRGLVRDRAVRPRKDERSRPGSFLRAQRVHRASVERVRRLCCGRSTAAMTQMMTARMDFAENLSADYSDYTDSRCWLESGLPELKFGPTYGRRRT